MASWRALLAPSGMPLRLSRARHDMVVLNSSQWPSFPCICPTAFWTVYAFRTRSMPQLGLPQLHMYSVETNFYCSFQMVSSHGYPQFLYWKSKRESPVNCPKGDSGWVFSTDLSLEGACFFPVSSKQVSWEKTHWLKSTPWKYGSQGRYDSQRPCFIRLWEFFVLE